MIMGGLALLGGTVAMGLARMAKRNKALAAVPA